MSGAAHEIAAYKPSWWRGGPGSVRVMPPVCEWFDAGWVEPNDFIDVYLNNGQRIRVRPKDRRA